MKEELLKEYAEEALKNGPHRFIRPDDKIFYMDGFKDGYNLGLKAIINMTTISDVPALPEDEDDYKFSIAKEAWDAVNICTPYHPESFVQGYIAGAEPRKKRIAELEQKLEQTENDLADYQFNYPTIKELEKENAELKKKLNVFSKESANACFAHNEKSEQLTKAKDIIKNLMVYVPVDLKEYEETKQFLKENSTYERIQKAKYNYTD